MVQAKWPYKQEKDQIFTYLSVYKMNQSVDWVEGQILGWDVSSLLHKSLKYRNRKYMGTLSSSSKYHSCFDTESKVKSETYSDDVTIIGNSWILTSTRWSIAFLYLTTYTIIHNGIFSD